jgi:hypothetical protein
MEGIERGDVGIVEREGRGRKWDDSLRAKDK